MTSSISTVSAEINMLLSAENVLMKYTELITRLLRGTPR